MSEPFSPAKGWRAKFANALRGVQVGVRTENSFLVHLTATLLVVGLATWLQLERTHNAILAVCVFSVLGAELLNTSIERLARAVDEHQNPQLKDALDLASGAVLLISVGAAVVAAIIFLPPVLGILRNV